MQNHDEGTIFGPYTGRLRGETVDVLHEQIKYRFKLCLLVKGVTGNGEYFRIRLYVGP
jgi:hypothetical protein